MSWNNEIPWSYDTLYDLSALSSALDILLIERVREEAGGTIQHIFQFCPE